MGLSMWSGMGMNLIETIDYTGPSLEELTDLPLPPPGEDGKHRSHIVILSSPGFHYGEDYYKVDQSFVEAQIQAYQDLTDQGYTAPILREHMKEGVRLGDVLMLKSYKDPLDERLKLLALVSWSIDNAEKLIETGQLKYTSPGFSAITDERGRSFDDPFVLVEVSIVSSPHQKSITTGAHILNKEHDMSEEKTLKAQESLPLEEQGPDLAETVRALSARVDALETTITAMETAKEEAPEETSEEAPEMSEIDELKAKIILLEDEKQRASFAQLYKPLLMTMSEVSREQVFQLYTLSPEAFEVMASSLTPEEAEQSQEPVSQLKPCSWGLRLGESSSSEPEPLTRESAYAQAKAQAKGDASQALSIYKSLTHSMEV